MIHLQMCMRNGVKIYFLSLSQVFLLSSCPWRIPADVQMLCEHVFELTEAIFYDFLLINSPFPCFSLTYFTFAPWTCVCMLSEHSIHSQNRCWLCNEFTRQVNSRLVSWSVFATSSSIELIAKLRHLSLRQTCCSLLTNTFSVLSG